MTDDASDKWNAIYRNRDRERPSPARVLADYRYLLPEHGLALDLACGRGGNALLLAASGLETHAWDGSGEALARINEFTMETGLSITTRQCDLTLERPGPESFDVIVVSNYLDRSLPPFLSRGLKTNGLLFYETFITEKIDNAGPKNPAFLLRPNELLHMFRELHILLYREDGLAGDTRQGLRNKAMLIGQKR